MCGTLILYMGMRARGSGVIDSQDWTATEYVGTTMGGNATVFGVNFADGRIKGYPKEDPRGRRGATADGGVGTTHHTLYVRYVRGNEKYGKNDFVDTGDGTVLDRATGLMWSKEDSGKGMDWGKALAWVQNKNKEKYLGHADWRLPNAKELQSIVDYGRAPEARDAARRGPAIDGVFKISKLGDGEYPFFWSSTTHLDGPPDRMAGAAVYVSFGRALGWMQRPPGRGEFTLMDVHGAGGAAERSEERGGEGVSAWSGAAGGCGAGGELCATCARSGARSLTLGVPGEGLQGESCMKFVWLSLMLE